MILPNLPYFDLYSQTAHRDWQHHEMKLCRQSVAAKPPRDLGDPHDLQGLHYNITTKL